MSSETDLQLLAEDVNIAVIKLSTRRYPGVLIQGDSLHGLLATVKEIQILIHSDIEEAKYALDDLEAELEWRVRAYEKAVGPV